MSRARHSTTIGHSSGSNLTETPLQRIAKQLRLVENRRCCDCNVILGDGRNTFVNVDFCVYICKHCALVHMKHINDSAIISAFSNTWTTYMVDRMIAAISNVEVNKILERYPSELEKAVSDSDEYDRMVWIRLKYNFVFAIPMATRKEPPQKPPRTSKKKSNFLAGNKKQVNKDDQLNSMDRSGELPVRLADYFLVFGPDVPTEAEDAQWRRAMEAEMARNTQSPSTVLDSSSDTGQRESASGGRVERESSLLRKGGRNLDSDTSGVASPQTVPTLATADSTVLAANFKIDQVILSPALENVYPLEPHSNKDPVPDASSFVFPSGLSLSSESLPPKLTSFVMTDATRVKVYGVSLIFYELLENEQLLQLLPSPIADKYKRFLASLEAEGRQESEHHDRRGSTLNRFSVHESVSNTASTAHPRATRHTDPPTDGSRPLSPRQALAALEASEKAEPEVTSRGGEARDSMRILKEAPLGSGLVYTQRAIVVLGHYPFYHAFSEFLSQMYHASLGLCPIPLERFIINFLSETPLPPLGRTEVNLIMPSKSLMISRPPDNKLPMIDFSYRPLFSCLSVENIKIVFKMICAESNVCFYCENTSLLTPIAEAFTSFLFPYVWQGAYIPLLPRAMLEYLHAPVPLIMGCPSHYITEMPAQEKAKSVLYVDIDNDLVHLGNDLITDKSLEELHSLMMDDDGMDPARVTNLQILIDMEPKQFVKLDSKLREYGGCLYSRNQKEKVLSEAGYPFPHDEHLTPITEYLMDTGVVQQDNHIRDSSIDRTCTATRSLDRQTIDGTKMMKKSDSNTRSSTQFSYHVLDPGNNCSSDGDGDGHFNASEIRAAFLRFFISLLVDEDEHYKSNTLKAKAKGFFGSKSPVSHSSNPEFSSGSGLGPITLRTSDGKEKQVSRFFYHLSLTQMNDVFKDERDNYPSMPEIKFFMESIEAKKNRSMTSMFTQAQTPFLTNTKNDVQQVWRVPLPDRAGLEQETEFSYERFPELQRERFGKIKGCAQLVETPELRRRQKLKPDKLHQLQSFLKHSSALSDLSGQGGGADPGRAVVGQPTTYDKKVKEKEQREAFLGQLTALVEAQKGAFAVCCAGLSYFQAQRRMHSQRRLYKKMIVMCTRIQTAFRAHRAHVSVGKMRMLQERIEYMQMIVYTQACIRRFIAICHFKKVRTVVRWVQTRVRGARDRAYVSDLVSKLQRINGIILGFTIRLRERKRRKALLGRYRHMLVLLWKVEQTPFKYRGLFYSTLTQASYLNLAIYRDEALRLVYSLGLLRDTRQSNTSNDTSNGNGSIRSKRGDKARLLERLTKKSPLYQQILACKGNTNGKDALAQSLGMEYMAEYTELSARLEQERNSLRLSMREQLDDEFKEQIFADFGLPPAKGGSRKVAVVNSLFRNVDSLVQLVASGRMIHAILSFQQLSSTLEAEETRASTSIFTLPNPFASTSTTRATTTNKRKGRESGREWGEEEARSVYRAAYFVGNIPEEWSKAKRNERISAACVETVSACLEVIRKSAK